MDASNPPVDLASLPQELLYEILKDCDDALLYRLAWTCRALHMAALPLLFRKYTDSLNDGRLSLANYPNYILPAVHGALFVRDLKSIYVHMHNNVVTMYRDLRIIKDLVARSTSVKFFTLNFTMVGQHPTNGMTTSDKLCGTLRELMELTIEKGCEWIDIMSDHNIQWIYTDRTPPSTLKRLTESVSAVGKKERSKRSNFLSALWGKAGSVFRNRDNGEKSANAANSKPAETTPSPDTSQPPDPVPLPESSSSPDETIASPLDDVVLQNSPNRYADTNLNYISLYSQLFFEGPLRDWTLSVLQSPNITSLRVDQDSLLLEPWLKAMPLIHIPSLRHLAYTCTKQEVPVKEFADFLARHGPSIRDLVLKVTPFQPKSEGDSAPEQMPTPAIDFQNLQLLSSDARTINWILSAAKAACVGGEVTECLPKLTHVSFRSLRLVRTYNTSIPQTEWSELDAALATLSTLMPQQDSPSSSTRGWLTRLDIESDDSVGFKQWANMHISNPSVSQLASLRNVESLSLEASHRHFEDVEVAMFPKLWALFPNLEEVVIRKVWLDRMKTRGVGYWREVNKNCPKLETVKCNWTTYLKMQNLLRNEWPECLAD